MSAVVADYQEQPDRDAAPAPVRSITTAPSAQRKEPARVFDPVTFRMAGTPAQRNYAERLAESTSWRGANGDLPNPADRGALIARTAVECLLGLRPVQQLTRWLDEPVYDVLARKAGLTMRILGAARGQRAWIRGVHVQQPDEITAEVSVVLHDGRRCRAAALRLECFHGRWLVTALEIG